MRDEAERLAKKVFKALRREYPDRGVRMYSMYSDKPLAQSILRHLLVGVALDAVRFRSPKAFTLLFEPPGHIDCGGLYLHLESRWAVYPSAEQIPTIRDENDVHMTSDPESQLLQLYSLHPHRVLDVTLHEQYCHLIIYLDDHRVLFLNGFHRLYESCEIGTVMADGDSDYLVIATPGGKVTFSCPPAFRKAARAE